MASTAGRQRVGLGEIFLVFGVVVVVAQALSSGLTGLLLRSQPATGAVLAAAILLLVVTARPRSGVRRRLPRGALGFHVLLATGVIGLGIVHVGGIGPCGPLEGLLSLVAGSVVLSGAVALLVRVRVPPVRPRDGRVRPIPLDRVRVSLRELRGRVHRLVLRSVLEGSAPDALDAVHRRLGNYFDHPVPPLLHGFLYEDRVERVLAELEASPAATQPPDPRHELARLIRMKRALDEDFARQWLERWIRKGHRPLTGIFLGLILVHAVVALGWSSGGFW